MNLTGLAALPDTSRRIALRLLGHRSVRRLQGIRQLGFSSSPQLTRLQHTVDSLEVCIGILRNAPYITRDLQDHVIATTILEDIGRAPFSNSLDPIFTGLPETRDLGAAVDVKRSAAVIDFLERSEQIISGVGLSPEIIYGLLVGRVPWRNAGWLRSFLNGCMDIDRLSYVSGDFARADGQIYDIRNVIGGLLVTSEYPTATIDNASVEMSLDFLLHRGQLYQEVYYNPNKLALEHVVRVFLKKLWNYVELADNRWNELREPRSVEEFLLWNDATVIGAFEGNRWDSAPRELWHLRNAIHDRRLQVAEVGLAESTIVDLTLIDMRLMLIREAITQREHCWLLLSRDLPSFQVYEPESVMVQHHKKVRPLEAQGYDIELLMRRRKRSPLLIFPTADFGPVQECLREASLGLVKSGRLTTIAGSSIG